MKIFSHDISGFDVNEMCFLGHQMKNDKGPRNASYPDLGNTILLGAGIPPELGNSK